MKIKLETSYSKNDYPFIYKSDGKNIAIMLDIVPEYSKNYMESIGKLYASSFAGHIMFDYKKSLKEESDFNLESSINNALLRSSVLLSNTLTEKGLEFKNMQLPLLDMNIIYNDGINVHNYFIGDFNTKIKFSDLDKVSSKIQQTTSVSRMIRLNKHYDRNVINNSGFESDKLLDNTLYHFHKKEQFKFNFLRVHPDILKVINHKQYSVNNIEFIEIESGMQNLLNKNTKLFNKIHTKGLVKIKVNI